MSAKKQPTPPRRTRIGGAHCDNVSAGNARCDRGPGKHNRHWNGTNPSWDASGQVLPPPEPKKRGGS